MNNNLFNYLKENNIKIHIVENEYDVRYVDFYQVDQPILELEFFINPNPVFDKTEYIENYEIKEIQEPKLANKILELIDNNYVTSDELIIYKRSSK